MFSHAGCLLNVLLLVFLGISSLMWLTVFGYLFLLGSLVLRRASAPQDLSSYPKIAVVVPTLNEEEMIGPKLSDLKHVDYPKDRMTVVVVDGGSLDRTRDVVQRKIDQGEDIRLMRLNGAPGKASQINHALGRLEHEIVVVTDVDSRLEPSCVGRLVSVLENDSRTAVVGAVVRPDSVLLEERIHWWFLNYLWWLEGEGLSSAMVSGVAYACRRRLVLPLAQDAGAEDIHMALAASAKGYRARICRSAHATEVRVPQRASELVRFRRRRGLGYLVELVRSSPHFTRAPFGWRLARLVRMWHFVVTPKIGVVVVLLAGVLLVTQHWPWPLVILTAFTAPVLGTIFTSSTLAGNGEGWWRLSVATLRLMTLTLVSMLTLSPGVLARGSAKGGS